MWSFFLINREWTEKGSSWRHVFFSIDWIKRKDLKIHLLIWCWNRWWLICAYKSLWGFKTNYVSVLASSLFSIMVVYPSFQVVILFIFVTDFSSLQYPCFWLKQNKHTFKHVHLNVLDKYPVLFIWISFSILILL